MTKSSMPKAGTAYFKEGGAAGAMRQKKKLLFQPKNCTNVQNALTFKKFFSPFVPKFILIITVNDNKKIIVN